MSSLLTTDVGGNVNQYPPGNLSSSAYMTTLSGQPSGNGTYVSSASSDGGLTNGYAYAAFGGGGGYWASSGGGQYNTGTGAYAGSSVTIDANATSYSGEWIQLQLPYAIILSSYTITSSYVTGYTPKSFVLLGSSDGTTWYAVDGRTPGGASEAALSGLVCSNLSGGTRAHSIYRLVITSNWKAVNVVVNALSFSGALNPVVLNTPNVPLSGTVSFSQIKAAYGSVFGSNFQSYVGGGGFSFSNFSAFRGKTAPAPVVGSNLLAGVTTPIAGSNAIVAPGGTIVGTAGATSSITINLQNYASSGDGTLTCVLTSYTGSATTVSVTGSTLTLGSTSPSSGAAVVKLTNRFGNEQYVTFPYSFLPAPPTTTGLIAMYTGESYTNGVWADITGNGNNATVAGGNVAVIKSGLNGTRAYLIGTSATTVTFPSTILPSTYSLMHVARYEPTGSTFGNILAGATSNAGFLSGFWNGLTGCAYHNGTVAMTTGTALVDWAVTNGGSNYGKNWLLSLDTNTTYRANGVTVGTTGAGAPSFARLSINSYQPSDFDIGCIAVYNTAISIGNSSSYEYWLGSNYGIPIATASAAPSIGLNTTAGATANVNLASLASNCSSYLIVVNPNGNNMLSLSGSNITITGSLQSTVNYTVIVRGNSSNGSYTFIPISVAETASTPTPQWTTSAGLGWSAASNAYIIAQTTGVNQSLSALCTVAGGTPSFSITSNPRSNASIVSGNLITSGGYRNATYNVGVMASFSSNGNTTSNATTFVVVEGRLTSVTLAASNLSYSGLSNVAVTNHIYVSSPASSYLTGATYLYGVTGQAGSWSNTFSGILSIGATNGQLSITPAYRGNGSTTYTANVTATVTLNGATASNGSIAIPVTEAILPAPTWASPSYSYTSIVGTGPLGNSSWVVALNSAAYCTASVGTLSFQVTSVSPSQSTTPFALAGSTLTVTGAYRGTTSYTINVQGTATFGSFTSTASAGFVIQEGNVPSPVWSGLPLSFNGTSLGSANSNYSSLIANLATYCTNGTNYYITTSPASYVSFNTSNSVQTTSSTPNLYSALNKPGVSSSITVAASNIGVFSQSGTAATFAINESPYYIPSSIPASMTAPVSLTLSSYFQGAGSYTLSNLGSCPEASINTTTFAVTNNSRGSNYSFSIHATANGQVASSGTFQVLQPIATPVWTTVPTQNGGFVNFNLSPYLTCATGNATIFYKASGGVGTVSPTAFTSASPPLISYTASITGNQQAITLSAYAVANSYTSATATTTMYINEYPSSISFATVPGQLTIGNSTSGGGTTTSAAQNFSTSSSGGTVTYAVSCTQAGALNYTAGNTFFTITPANRGSTYTVNLNATNTGSSGLATTATQRTVTIVEFPLAISFATYPPTQNLSGTTTTGALSFSLNGNLTGLTISYTVTGTGVNYTSGTSFTITPANRNTTYTVTITAYNTGANGTQTTATATVTVNEIATVFYHKWGVIQYNAPDMNNPSYDAVYYHGWEAISIVSAVAAASMFQNIIDTVYNVFTNSQAAGSFSRVNQNGTATNNSSSPVHPYLNVNWDIVTDF